MRYKKNINGVKIMKIKSSNEFVKKYDRVETPGGIVKLPRPMNDKEYSEWVSEHNRKIRQKLAHTKTTKRSDS